MTAPGSGPSTRRRFLRGLGTALVGVGAATGLAGCGYQPGGGDIRWTEDRPGFRTEEVVVSGGTVYSVVRDAMDIGMEVTEDSEGVEVTGGGIDRVAEVTAIPTTDRTGRWSIEYDRPATAFGFGAGAAAVGLDGAVVRLGPDGKVWRRSVSWSPAALTTTEQRVYALSTGGRLYALADAEEAWRRDVGGGGAEGSTLAASGEAVVVYTGADLVGFAPDGTRRWTQEAALAGDVTIRNGLLFVVDRAGAFDPRTGEEVLSTPRLSGVDGVAVTEERVYVRSDGELVAVDRSGTRRWSFDATRYNSGVAANGTGAFVATERGLTALAPDGSRRWTVDYEVVDAGPFLVDDGVLVATRSDFVCHVP